MTIKELRQEFQKTVKQAERMTGKNSNLVNYYKTEWATLETLYAEGAVNRRTDYISDDMLALATGYDPQKTDDGFTVVRCLDLAYIYATKKHVRNMMMIFLGLERQAAEQPTEEQQTEEQAADNQTTEQVEDTAEQQEEQAKPGKPEMKLRTFKQLVVMLADDGTTAEKLDEIAALTDLSYQHDKITAKDHETIYCIINKLDIIYNLES